VLRKCLDWFDDRTDYRRILLPIRCRVLPDGPSWGLTTASCLLWLVVVQIVTGFLLMATYSPSMTSAWASVHFIDQYQSGSFLRGVHYYAAQAMIVLFVFHLMRVTLVGAFRAPKDLIWITGLILLPLVIVWAITGNPLSGSQKGMSQIDIEGAIIGSTPVLGPIIQRILIGGEEVGNLTLTHLYFLHVGFMPLVVGALLVFHLYQVYRHGVSNQAEVSTERSRPYWPYQSARNMVVLAIVMGVVAAFAWFQKAPLDFPADSQFAHTPRPEWYFLSLFELRRYFSGQWEFIATMVIPGCILLFMLLLPLIDRLVPQLLSAILRCVLVLVVGGGVIGLTVISLQRDYHDEHYQDAVAESAQLSRRALTLAGQLAIPPEGAVTLLRNDPKTQGPRLYKRHCASCHPYTSADNSAAQGEGIASEDPTAPNLYGFGSADWIAGMLDPEKIASEHYFGNTLMADGDMVSAITDAFDLEDEEEIADLHEQMQKVARALAAEAARPEWEQADVRDAEIIEAGKELLIGDLACIDCHKFGDEGELGDAPDLTGYGSREWLEGMISDPNGERFYADDRNDRMPAFAEDPVHTDGNQLSPKELHLLTDWLLGQWYEVPAAE